MLSGSANITRSRDCRSTAALIYFYAPAFISSVLRPAFTAYFSAGGDAGEWRLWGKDSPNWEDGSELKRAAVVLLGKEELNLVKHVVISSEKSGLGICTKLWCFFSSRFKNCILNKHREKQTNQSEDLGRNKTGEGIRAIGWEGAQRDQRIPFTGRIA